MTNQSSTPTLSNQSWTCSIFGIVIAAQLGLTMCENSDSGSILSRAILPEIYSSCHCCFFKIQLGCIIGMTFNPGTKVLSRILPLYFVISDFLHKAIKASAPQATTTFGLTVSNSSFKTSYQARSSSVCLVVFLPFLVFIIVIGSNNRQGFFWLCCFFVLLHVWQRFPVITTVVSVGLDVQNVVLKCSPSAPSNFLQPQSARQSTSSFWFEKCSLYP